MPASYPRCAVVDLSDQGAEIYVVATFCSYLKSWGVLSSIWTVPPMEAGGSGINGPLSRYGELQPRRFNSRASSEEMLAAFADQSKNVDLALFMFELHPLAEATFLPEDRSTAVLSMEAALESVRPLALPVLLVGPPDSRTHNAVEWLKARGIAARVVALEAVPGRCESTQSLTDPVWLGTLPNELLKEWSQPPVGSIGVSPSAVATIDWPRLIKFSGAAASLSVRAEMALRPVTPRRHGSPTLAQPGSTAKVLMIQGTSSNVGKTFIATALARYFSNQGVSVAPFKAQNMSNNARVVLGGEIGTAQYFQAVAARTRPDVRMNPVLIKPQANSMKVVIDGKVDQETAPLPWRLRKPLFWPHITRSLKSLCAEYQLVIVEGAGSPAETYLANNDVVNMRVAEEVGASVLLVGDAARGGVFAHLFGTWSLLPRNYQQLVKGFVLNLSFQNGRPEMFVPGCEHLAHLTGGIPTLGIVPRIESVLPDEDRFSMADRSRGGTVRVVIAAYPQGSNLDEFSALHAVHDLETSWGREPEDFSSADIIVLPGSRDVVQDLHWMRERGLASAIVKSAQEGKRILGICGGLQMLGEAIDDPVGIEGSGIGLQLLGVNTVFHREKIQRPTSVIFARVPAPWAAFSALAVSGYEIRHGVSEIRAGDTRTVEIIPGGIGFACGSVLGIYLHGLFENANIVKALFGSSVDFWSNLQNGLDEMASLMEAHLNMDLLGRLLRLQ